MPFVERWHMMDNKFLSFDFSEEFVAQSLVVLDNKNAAFFVV